MKTTGALALLLSLTMTAQDNEKACAVFSKVNTVLQTRHYKPKPVDDSLSVYVFNTVMENLDDNRTLFLQQEYDKLSAHKHSLDDYLAGKDCSFFNDFTTLYLQALHRKKNFVMDIAKEELPYYTQDTIFYSVKSFPFHTDPERIKKFLRKKITYDILDDVAMQGKDKDSIKLHLDKLGSAAKAKVIDSYLCRINEALNPAGGFEHSMHNLFYSAFCSYFDPHSTYFNYDEKASFVSNISTENYSLGLYVSQNEKEEIIVEEIVPGGPAYHADKISKGDQIIRLAANNMEYAVSCSSLDAITDIVFSDTYKNVELTLRKKDGTIYSVTLEKQVMKADDHSVYSFVLGDKKPIGYIKIPSFYTAFENEVGNGCADDLARELAKLKKDNIQGLIIDLQYNGGGSMDEVIKMCGMFINQGPLSVITDGATGYNVIKDYDRGMLYSGPMVVLVNGFSASASEFFAGVMQDYSRAVIAGSTTVGKATMQTILPLDDSNPKDFVKVTVDKFYRVTGKSSQYKGIVPDVVLPTFFDELLTREKSLPNAIKNDSLEVDLKFRRPSPAFIQELALISKSRTENSADFNLIRSVNDRISQLYKGGKMPMPVTFDTVFDDAHAMDDLRADITRATEKQQSFAVRNPSGTVQDETFMKNANQYRIKSVRTDVYVNEALNILSDYNNL